MKHPVLQKHDFFFNSKHVYKNKQIPSESHKSRMLLAATASGFEASVLPQMRLSV